MYAWQDSGGRGESIEVHCVPHAGGPVPRWCPMGELGARAGAPAAHGSTSVEPTVDSYGPPPPHESSQADMDLLL